MQFISWTVLFVFLFVMEPSAEQGPTPWRPKLGGLSNEENQIISNNFEKNGVEFHGKQWTITRSTTTRRPIVWTRKPPVTQTSVCPIIECIPSTILNLSNTGLKRVGDDFIDSSNTRELYLDNNEITEFSPIAIMSLTMLEVLSLCENNLTTENILWFKEHKTLRQLIIDDNKRRAEDMSIRKTLQSLPKLRELSLRRNAISRFEVSVKKFAPGLILLDLSGNDIESTDFLDDLPGTLSVLRLDDNAIFKIRENVLNNLTSLSLSGNKFKQLCRDEYESSNSLDLKGMRKLVSLNMSRNDIDTVSDGAFMDTVNLVTLDLSGNELKSLPKDVFHGLNKLKELRLNDNKLVAVPNVCPLNSLKLLDLSSNVIEAVADLNFCSTMYVETILLANNHILHVVDNAFVSLQRLRTLDLSKNLIDKLPMTLITNSRQLEVLSLKDNMITDIDELYSYNTIRLVAEQYTLQKLHLEGNPFVSHKIGYMPNLTILLKERNEHPLKVVNATDSNPKANNKDDDSDESSSNDS